MRWISMRIINTGDLRPARITTWDPLAGWLYRAGIYIVQEQQQLSSSSSGGFSHIFADKSLWLWEKRIIPSMIHRSPLLFPASEPLQSITIWLLDIIGLLYYEPVYIYAIQIRRFSYLFFFFSSGRIDAECFDYRNICHSSDNELEIDFYHLFHKRVMWWNNKNKRCCFPPFIFLKENPADVLKKKKKWKFIFVPHSALD